jgi:preprotein translocase subunit SecA
VLEYDDVMNEQRRVVYKYRREILEGRDMSDVAHTELEEVVGRLVETYTPGEIFEDWDLGGLEAHVGSLWPLGASVTELDPQSSSRERIVEILSEDALAAYGRREEEFGAELMRYLERQILLQIIDNRWREHLYEMDYLREGIHLRGFAQIDPLVAYKNEGFAMFETLMNSIWEEFAKLIFHVEIEVAPRAQEQFGPTRQPANVELSGGTLEAQPSAMEEVAAGSAPAGIPGVTSAPAGSGGAPPAAVPRTGNGGGDGTNPQTVVKGDEEKIGRNDPCWCGSGKKYKKCHGA